jgi:carbon monoxide dehydrogenase subunit G
MTRQPQGASEIVIHASPEKIWALLEDSTRLAEWAPMVKRTTGRREALGAVRECEVEFDGRPGRVVEKCVECRPFSKIGWLMVEDSFGFSGMLDDLGFDFALEPVGPQETRVINTSYYRPKGLLAKLMGALMMRPKFRKMRERVLANLKRLMEEPQTIARVEASNSRSGHFSPHKNVVR